MDALHMQMLVAGLSHRTAPVAVRERVALPAHEVPAALDSLLTRVGFREGLILSTCNRTEVYGLVGPRGDHGTIESFFTGLRPGLDGILDPASHLYLHQGESALRHVFRVASGLDSMVLGEQEIARQMSGAYDVACSSGAAGPMLRRMVPRALQVGKRVRTETGLCRGTASVAGAAVSLCERVFRDVAGCSILTIGAGETVRSALKSLRPGARGRLVIANRSAERAEALARDFSGEAVPLESLATHAASADIVVTATGAPAPHLTRDALRKALGRRGSRPLLILDLGVPRDVDPAIRDLTGVYLYDVDDLQGIAESGRKARELEVPRAEAIVQMAVSDFRRRQRELGADPAIRALLDGLLSMRTDLIAREPGLDATQRAVADRVTGKFVDRLLRRIAPRLKQGDAGAREVLEAFGIEPPPDGV